MRKITFISTYVGLHICFAFLQVYKQSSLVKLSYQKQKNEKLLTELGNQKSNLLSQLEQLKDKTLIKKYAVNNLKMEKVRLENIKRLSYDQA